ncbi:uncharacterized protein RAG0_16671 [Rhynchosporium agropyri]|uniref:Uncharacterized protein n=1 Tax=Rhynchosporium agropyri TaxID=914238 RepID=A0A1E1LRI2_9HELO|nr:uncharacterized protein RAG0_16671 [Rhynchosporium agropyri]
MPMDFLEAKVSDFFLKITSRIYIKANSISSDTLICSELAAI